MNPWVGGRNYFPPIFLPLGNQIPFLLVSFGIQTKEMNHFEGSNSANQTWPGFPRPSFSSLSSFSSLLPFFDCSSLLVSIDFWGLLRESVALSISVAWLDRDLLDLQLKIICSIGQASKQWFSISSFSWLGSSTFLDVSVSADGSCKSCLCSPSCEESCVEREKHTFFDALEEFSCGTGHNDNFSLVETPASADPLAKEPISALKGSRKKQGKYPITKLSVKWAPEVYDPPITSSSHTVKDHHRRHRHKTKKDYNTHKYVKGKSSRGNVSERKHTHHRSSSNSLMDPRILRSQALGISSRQVPNSSGQSKMEPPERGVIRSPDIIIHGSTWSLLLLFHSMLRRPPNTLVEGQNLITLFCSSAV